MTAPVVPPPLPAKPKSWMDRNWKWFVPVLAVGAMLVLGGFVAGIGAVVIGTLKRSEPYRVALERVGQVPEAVAVLGTPAQPSWWVMGNFSTSGSSGSENLQFNVTGPKGSGTVFVFAIEHDNVWTYRAMALRPATPGSDGKKFIDLRPAPPQQQK